MLKTKYKRISKGILTFLLLMALLACCICGAAVSAYGATRYSADWLNALDEVADKIDRNNFWYSNDNNSRTYSKALEKKKVTNCARYVSWAMQEYGVVSKGTVMWLDTDGSIKGDTDKIVKNSSLKISHPGKSAAKCSLKPGDICGFAGFRHTAVYAGKDSKGHMLWYSAGRDGATESGGKYYFKASKVKARKRSSRYDGKICTVIRIRNMTYGEGPKAIGVPLEPVPEGSSNSKDEQQAQSNNVLEIGDKEMTSSEVSMQAREKASALMVEDAYSYADLDEDVADMEPEDPGLEMEGTWEDDRADSDGEDLEGIQIEIEEEDAEIIEQPEGADPEGADDTETGDDGSDSPVKEDGGNDASDASDISSNDSDTQSSEKAELAKEQEVVTDSADADMREEEPKDGAEVPDSEVPDSDNGKSAAQNDVKGSPETGDAGLIAMYVIMLGGAGAALMLLKRIRK